MMNSKPETYLFLMLLLTLATAGLAQEINANENNQKPAQKDETVTAQDEAPQLKEGELKLLLEKIEVTGELEKPQAVFIIPGKNPEIDDIRIKRSFFERIFRKVERRGRIVSRIQTQPTDDRKDYIPW